MSKPKRSLEDGGKRERANAAKAANARERNIAKQYLNAGPSIGNLARAAYHWYNSVPMLGGQNESGLILQTGEAPNPGMRNPKAIVKGLKSITKINAAKITPAQWTAAQDAAIARGDMAEAQRLRDLHFKVKSGNDNTVFAHTTNAKFTKFDKSHFGETDEGFNGKGFYFSSTRIPENPSIYSIAKGPNGEIPTMNYGKNKMYGYLKGDREFDVGNPERNFFEEPNTVGIVGEALDGRPHEVIIGNPNHIKLADAVTYNNNGVRIPLGERDNFNINDIRYSFAPIVAGGIGYGVYRNQKRDGGSIHIAPSTRGTFTAAATKHGMGVQEFASRVLRNKEDFSTAMIKKANFARNVSKWNN